MDEEKEIIIPYKPRPIWKNVIHPALEKYRFAVLVCHRRFGKTVGVLNEMVKQAIKCDLQMPRLAYVAPFRNQAKDVAWEYLKYYTAPIPGRRVNEAELFVELPTKFKDAAGARIYIVGANHPDNLRGLYWDMVVLDEYAQIKPALWNEVLQPALADRKGKAVFIGTPKGQNQFYERYMFAKKQKDWFTCHYTAEETGVIDDEELARLKADMTEIAYQQEMMCDFTVSAQNILIPILLVDTAAARELTLQTVQGLPVIMGVDVARFGDDSTVIWRRQGLWTDKPLVFRGLDTMAVADRVIMAMRQWKADICFIDEGNMGAGVIDRIRQLGYTNISSVNFGGAAMDAARYVNIRAEMYFKLKAWLESGGALPNDPDLKEELTVMEYKFTSAGKMQLEAKEDIKEKLGRSPDLADGLALTFARPYFKPTEDYGQQQEYNPLAGM